jgi:predicted HicB family RNase H-like nuclease
VRGGGSNPLSTKWCNEDGVEPEKPYSGILNLRMKPELHRRAAIRAKKNGVSLNRFIEKAIEDELLKD